jgi:lipopolysaccharide biosynthesis glycosyltransferase
MKGICPIVMCCDAGYLMPLATALRSIVDSHEPGDVFSVHIAHQGISEFQKRAVEESLPNGRLVLVWHEIDTGEFEKFWTLPHVSTMTFARLLIEGVLPADLERVLYLDVDILVTGDLRPLMREDLAGCTVGAVADRCDQKIKAKDPNMWNLPEVADYLNAGVLLIDMHRWRSRRVMERAMRFLASNPSTPFGDQDAINVAVDGDWRALDQKWNYQHHYKVKLEDLPHSERPTIVHFVMGEKPWCVESRSQNAKFYDSYRRRTRFARSRRQIAADAIACTWLNLKVGLKSLLEARK